MLSIIVAVSDNGVIGRGGGLPWSLPKEMAYFRQTTVGHPIIMGRKTHESIGKVLPDRLNVVVTREKGYKAAPGCTVVNSFEAALALPEIRNSEEVFIIGGESINQQALAFADKLYLTKVHARVQGDKFFNYNRDDWREIWSEKHVSDEENKYDFEFTILERRKIGKNG
ncbi:dihydrofolate reductase [Candidatus Saccharibacteria bacterium]|nr:dihydrofolate reductase [Candidatus Saccharibacteria bacterium]